MPVWHIGQQMDLFTYLLPIMPVWHIGQQMDLFGGPKFNRLHVNSQLVSLPPVGIFNKLLFSWQYLFVSVYPVNTAVLNTSKCCRPREEEHKFARSWEKNYMSNMADKNEPRALFYPRYLARLLQFVGGEEWCKYVLVFFILNTNATD